MGELEQPLNKDVIELDENRHPPVASCNNYLAIYSHPAFFWQSSPFNTLGYYYFS